MRCQTRRGRSKRTTRPLLESAPARDASCAFDARDQGFHQRSVPLTPETKDSINKDVLMKMPKSTTLINAARPE